MARRVKVLLEQEAGPDQVAAVEAVFTAAEIEADVEAGYGRKTAADLPPLLEISWAVKPFVESFFATLGMLTAKEAWPHLRDFVRDLFKARDDPEDMSITFRDSETADTAIIPFELPDEAYEQVLDFPESETARYLIWNRTSREWEDFNKL